MYRDLPRIPNAIGDSNAEYARFIEDLEADGPEFDEIAKRVDEVLEKLPKGYCLQVPTIPLGDPDVIGVVIAAIERDIKNLSDTDPEKKLITTNKEVLQGIVEELRNIQESALEGMGTSFV